jgi:hypothetical protein
VKVTPEIAAVPQVTRSRRVLQPVALTPVNGERLRMSEPRPRPLSAH